MEHFVNPATCCYPVWILWIPFSIYYLASVPQIVTNYKNKSAEGLSFRMVFFDYVGAISTTIYTFLLMLPLACRVMEPLTALNIGIMAVQGYIYTKHKNFRRNIVIVYGLLHLFCIAMLVLSLWHRAWVGNAMGWISMGIQCFTQLPQVLKNYRRRSVQGLSFLYMSMLGIAGMMEAGIGVMLAMPIQSVLNGLRGVFYYAVVCWQFYRYRHTVKKWW